VVSEQNSQITQSNNIAPEQGVQTTLIDNVAPEQDVQTTQTDDVVPELFENGEVLTQDNFFQYSGALTVNENGSFTSDLTLNNETSPSSSGTWTVTQAGTLRATSQFDCSSTSSYEWINGSDLQISSPEEVCGNLRQTKTWRVNDGNVANGKCNRSPRVGSSTCRSNNGCTMVY